MALLTSLQLTLAHTIGVSYFALRSALRIVDQLLLRELKVVLPQVDANSSIPPGVY